MTFQRSFGGEQALADLGALLVEALGRDRHRNSDMIAEHVAQYAVQLTRRTRPDHPLAPTSVKEYVSWGAGPRASQCLVLGAKARAALHGRYFVEPADIRAVAPPVLRHRIITNFNAEAEGVTPDEIVRRLIALVPRDPSEKSA